jgi:hypothetical protein
MAKTVKSLNVAEPSGKPASTPAPPTPQTPQEFYKKLVQRRDGRAILQRLAKR